MGSPQTSSEPVSTATPAPATQSAVGPAATSEAPASVASEVETELRAKLASVEQKLAAIEEGIKNGFNNRVVAVEQAIKRLLPYG